MQLPASLTAHKHYPRLLFALLAFFTSASIATAQVPAPTLGSTGAPVPHQPEVPASASLVFDFHSNFWLNLHHFLYEQARLRAHDDVTLGGGGKTSSSSYHFETEASPAWHAALDYYATNFIGKNLLFDFQLAAINNRLAELESCPDITNRATPACVSGLPGDLQSVLEAAAPVYRLRWWPEQDRANRLWIASVLPLVREMGQPLANQLAEVYQSPWPRAPILVDVTLYAGPYGAYTTLEPVHTMVSSIDPRNADISGLEVVFHEASHALAKPVSDRIASDCRELNKPIPRDLWHALIFYTTGVLVERALENPVFPAKSSVAPPPLHSYTPYAVRNGLYERDWQSYLRVLESSWLPYLNGRVPFDSAIERMVTQL